MHLQLASLPVTVPNPSRLKRYAAVIIRWAAITFVVFGITLWAGKYITENLMAKMYTATAEIEVVQPLDITVGSMSIDESAAKIQTEAYLPKCLEALDSPDVLLPVIHDLGLSKTWAKKFYRSDKHELSDEEASADLDKILKIELVRGTNIIKITASSDDPKEAADIANTIVDHYKAKRDIESDQRVTSGMNSLRAQIVEQEKTVADKKSTLLKMKNDSSPIYEEAHRNLQEQQSILDALTVKLKQDVADMQFQQSPVRIISRATVPTSPSSPNKLLFFFATVGVAALISVVAGCFIEVILLFVRAAEGEHS